jgi:2'-5' RNA ligase
VQPTESAVVVRIPEAERLVGRLRANLDVAAGLGVPAHMTVIAPFMPPGLIDDGALGLLAAAVGSAGAFEVTFARTRWFGRTVLWLAPDPSGPFRDLTAAVWQRFPGYPPYARAHPDVVPHLTVGIDRPAAELEAAARAIEPGLPFAARVTAAVLMRGSSEPGSWHAVAEFPLGSAPA